jgi:arylsulfatase A-like enzyme
VIWTSDNGAVLRKPPQGSSGPYRGYGYDTSEGAMRMPCLMRWPGHVPAGRVCDEIVSTMDLLPTFARLAGAALPPLPIDGHDVRRILLDKAGGSSPWDYDGFCYYRMEQLQAIRAGDWKLYLPLQRKFVANNRKTAAAKAELFDVRHDVHEDHEVSAEHPDVVERLTALAEKTRAVIGDDDRPGSGQRPAGHVDSPQPLLLPGKTLKP